MERALSSLEITVGKIIGDQPRVTPAVLVYCEKLVDYLTSMPLDLSAINTAYGPAQDLRNALAAPGADVRAVLYKALADVINFEIEEANGDVPVTMGLGRVYGTLEALFFKSMLDRFASTLVFAVRDCTSVDTPSRWEDYGDVDFIVNVGVERLRLFADVDLIDGMLVSEARENFEGPLDHCVCLEGVALWPYKDAQIVPNPNDEADEGTYRLQPEGSLDGSLFSADPENSYLVFRNPSFLQGIQSMDAILKAPSPSWKNLQVYQNGQWRAATAQ